MEIIYNQQRQQTLHEFLDAVLVIGLCRVHFDGLVEILYLPVGQGCLNFVSLCLTP